MNRSEDEFYAAQERAKKRKLRIQVAEELGLVLDFSRVRISDAKALKKAKDGYYAYVRVGGCIYRMGTLDHPRLDSLVEQIMLGEEK